jgi:hypothetical protein
MERIAEADEPAGPDLVRYQARDPAAQGLAPDDQPRAAAEPRDHVEPRLAEHRLGIGRSPPAIGPPRPDVRELEPDHAHRPPRQSLGDGAHEGRVHRGASPVGEDQRAQCSVGPVNEKLGIRHDVPS